jgi:cation-transporting P-type ATPase E
MTVAPDMTSTGAHGLTTAQVAERVAAGKVNVVEETTSRPLKLIITSNVFTRFNAILGTLAVLVLVNGSWKDATFGLLMVANALIGIVQEVRAKKKLDGLAVLNAPLARVRRDGALAEIAVGGVVVDDLVELRAGDQVPTDGSVVTSVGLEIDESLLTGESDPVSKQPDAEVLSGSIVVAGQGSYVATRVGADAYARKLAADARKFTVTRSELMEGINKLLGYISWGLLVIGPILFWSERRSTNNWREAITGATAGLVGMVPEGLVLLTSVAFLLAALTLARKNVLVQELPAVEGLARVDVVCLDKTGTLTEGEIDFASLEELDGRPDGMAPIEEMLGALADDPNPNGTLGAISRAFRPPTGWERQGTVAFSSARKWSGVTFADHGSWVIGAPEILLSDTAAEARKRSDEIASTGQRVLVLAQAEGDISEDESLPTLRPAALLMFKERIRTDAAETLAYFTEQGVTLKVISGDNTRTVGAVAASVGLPNADRIFDARELPEDPEQLADIVDSHAVFGRVTPQQKRAIVRALQSRGHVVAMTGDGVNDALALKDADIGVAMGSGAPATRSVAQLVLMDGKFSHMPRVVAEGRRVIANIERVASLFIIKNIYSAMLALAVSVARVPYPFLPRHLTLISSFTIGIPAFFLALAPNNTRYQPGFLKRVLRFSIPTGLVTSAAIYISYEGARALNIEVNQARTAACVTTVVVGLVAIGLLARPLTQLKLALIGAMGVFFALALVIAPIRDFFALKIPLKALVESVGIGAAAGTVLWFAHRQAGRRTAKNS